MKIAIIGGGPAGLFFAYLMKRADASHQVRLFERDSENTTYGWGLVFSDVAMSFVRDVAPELHQAMTHSQMVHRDMAVVHRGTPVRLANNTFHRIARIDLLRTLHRYCSNVGVELCFERRLDGMSDISNCDLVVAADGAHSVTRGGLAEHFKPTLNVRPNWLAWYATTQLFGPLSLIFRNTTNGLFIAHAYQFSATLSTFLVECDPMTFKTAGLDCMSESQSLRCCEQVFEHDLGGRKLISNASRWFQYTIVKNQHWHWQNVVLLGDALRTGHPSVGSGTRMAMQDSIALFEAWQRCGEDVPRLLADFERSRRPGSDKLQDAAIRSTEWYESLEPKISLDPVSFAYDYMLRCGRVDHAEVRRRDPELAAAYEGLHPELAIGGGAP
jgi:2-polyprenyl-6-methoxyphenol hydroxylase-like FAD-dependent oxidoreductase